MRCWKGHSSVTLPPNKVLMFAALMLSGLLMIFFSTRPTVTWNCPPQSPEPPTPQKPAAIVERRQIRFNDTPDNTTVMLLNGVSVPASVVVLEERNVRSDLRKGLWGTEVDAWGNSFFLSFFLQTTASCSPFASFALFFYTRSSYTHVIHHLLLLSTSCKKHSYTRILI